MNAPAIKPIETVYKGHRFRSRLEARWAVWLDNIGWTWEYEPQGYDLGGGDLYLPDFKVSAPARRDYETDGPVFWLEIKAGKPSEDELRKAMKLAQQSGMSCLFGIGIPDPKDISHGLFGYDDDGQAVDASIDSYCFHKWGQIGRAHV